MEKYKKGSIITVKVTGIKDYGIFVLTEDNVSGLIHISEVSSSFVQNISDYVEEGEIIKAKVLDFDEKNAKLKLSIKDFAYRKNSRFHAIKETEKGFSTLKINLDKWIRAKQEEIEN